MQSAFVRFRTLELSKYSYYLQVYTRKDYTKLVCKQKLLSCKVYSQYNAVMKVAEIVILLGGSGRLAQKLGIKSQSVSQWIRSNRIPVARVPELEKISRKKGLPLRAEDMRPDVDWSAIRTGT